MNTYHWDKRMDIDVESRRKRLKMLGDFVASAREKIFGLVKDLQWDIKSLDQKEEMVKCPYDGGHVMPKSSLPSHVESCKFKNQCYHPEDKPFPPPSVDPNCSSILRVDKALQASILRQAKAKNPAMMTGYPGALDDRDVPMTSDRLMSSLTSDERAAIHSYVVSNTVSSGETKEISLLEQDLEKNFKNKKEEKKDKTPLEKLIEERNAKRRKESKKVHINRKSHVEIIREVIENQMEVYVEWLKDQNMLKTEDVESLKADVSENQSEGEISESDVKQEYPLVSSHMLNDSKPFESDRRERNREPRESLRNYNGRDQNEYSDSRGQNYSHYNRDSQSKYHHSRESGNKQYWEKEGTSYRGDDRKGYRDHDHKKYSYNEKESHVRHETKKYKCEKYWDGGAHVVKDVSSDEDGERETKVRKRYAEKTDSGKKRDSGKRHHKKKRRRHSSDSDGDRRAKHKKDVVHKRNE
ncbi:U11/U12 small nuclear ribonucleoprotein 48 kDa protein-like [Ischnura elegans]|uniref:U11/U12 small nuclear ribonucleoprotein 48 kDa protein-like n=1 Tax=Ischnura elegans TaxID=197161 RepID=UPI001ED8BECE|nr:U11/U12 small nuclear ribonucleoprotein 48 kDa protein-like [Ischnura elegans]